MTTQDTFEIQVCVTDDENALPDAEVHHIFSSNQASDFSEGRRLVLQTQQKGGHTPVWTLLHPASGSKEPILSLELGHHITVYQGSGASKQALTHFKKPKLLGHQRGFEHGGQPYCWQRHHVKLEQEEYRLVLTQEDAAHAAKNPVEQHNVVAEVRALTPGTTQLLVYQLGSLPMPLLVMTAMLMDFQRRQTQAPSRFVMFDRDHTQ